MPLSECTRACASLARVLSLIESTCNHSYVVGGYVRDSLMGRSVRDIDIVVPSDPFAVAQRVAQELDGAFVPLDQEHGIARVVCTPRQQPGGDAADSRLDALVIDFARYEGRVEDDLVRRDFTVDAMAVPVETIAARLSERGTDTGDITDSVLDPTGGLRDLGERRIRACGPQVFEEDPGRLLRAVRLARELGFGIDAQTEASIRDQAHLLSQVAAERTREELLKLLALPHAADSIRHLDNLGLLVAIFPELEASRNVEQPTCHFWDVLEHSIQTVATYEFVTGQSDWKYGNEEVLECVPDDPAHQLYLATLLSLEASRDALIKLACLLHDVAKPQTKSLDDSGRARFLGHAKQGSTLARDMLQRLRFSTQESSFVESLVCHHLRPAQMSTEGMPTRRAVYRFFRDTGTTGIGVLYLAMADYLACRGPLFTMSEWRGICKLVEYILGEHERQEATIAPSNLIDGYELMRALGMKPGPTVGVLLETIREAHAAGQVNSRDDALRLARRTIESEHFTVRTSK